MFIQEEMVIAKVWAGHMPVKVLRLKIKSEYIGKESVESPVIFMTDSGSMSDGVASGAFWRVVSSALLVISCPFKRWRPAG
jgi:hypothetical protein